QDAVAENLHLIGRPTLKGFLRFVTRHAVNPPGEGVLIEEWQAAHECVRILEKEEAGAADGPPMRRMGSEYEPLLIEFLKDPLVRHGFQFPERRLRRKSPDPEQWKPSGVCAPEAGNHARALHRAACLVA